MSVKKLSILGLRGYAAEQTITFAVPDGQIGSGLSIVVGANNTGKSTITEALRAFTQVHQTPSFSIGFRNREAGDMVDLLLEYVDPNRTLQIKSLIKGGSETQFIGSNHQPNLYVLPSRRAFNPSFSKGIYEREDYIRSANFSNARRSSIDQFSARLFRALQNRDAFNSVLEKIINPVPNWTIDQQDDGQYFLKFNLSTASYHNSEGLGEGLISLFFIIDALYDAKSGDVIVIDEPELSLHPAFQRKLAVLLAEYATTKQIIISTHSPYFINFPALKHGATIARTLIENGQSRIVQISKSTAQKLSGLLQDVNNPHVLGLNAQEIFFLDDMIILVEGQEDVIFFERVQKNLDITLQGSFYGWGVGGADKMGIIASLLKDLGFKKVVGIFDNNKQEECQKLESLFPDYQFHIIPADDIRTKKEVKARSAIKGLLDDDNTNIREEYANEAREMLGRINQYFMGEAV